MKFVITVSKSDGNETVGDMWTETHLFDGTATLAGVLKALGTDMSRRRRNITITLAHDDRRVALPEDELPF